MTIYNAYVICHTYNAVNIGLIYKLVNSDLTHEQKKHAKEYLYVEWKIVFVSRQHLIKQYILLSFNPVNLGTLLSFTRFFRKTE